ncbi:MULTISPECIES: tyrosine-protein phosphatase [unclassified Rhizobium]|uniref:tyrosine-protein phosphatase n=1 Tax=unclassified Rhizobium TaxID=2613769 RepID=UPI00161AD8A4|nr:MULTISPECIES: tyrosine-protein phosphatase [unclassified Rhizobium]MBB3318640.1 protein tyrosine/serine phosphatase [Rhizobium sp. BK181]MBB3543619.1 protein tyrosine/serine phosphatase [Rhizobium sp. BK399]MCS3741859.1 protein tyrosine/serine phosphatase [Rhizobium sp. BK661]MCS4095438.1 protein tyrosine/serine phosphatase [Rhizobium sp. BK176]
MTTIAPRQFPRSWRLAVQCLALLTLTIGGYAVYLFATDNFHSVVAGEVYRSSQPSPRAIAEFEKRYGIKTIISLRGGVNTPVWQAEVAQAKSLGIEHIDFPMSAYRELTPEQAKELIQVMKDAPKPLLIHCLSGSDRTGLAAALYLAAISKTNEHVAEGQMSILYGHIPLPISRAFAMDRTFEKLEPLLGFSES